MAGSSVWGLTRLRPCSQPGPRIKFLEASLPPCLSAGVRPPSGPCHSGPSHQGNHHLAACPFKASKGVRDAIRQMFQSCNVIMPSQPRSHIQHVMFCCWKQVTGPTLKGWITPEHKRQEVGIMYAALGVCPQQPQTRKFAQTPSTISSYGNKSLTVLISGPRGTQSILTTPFFVPMCSFTPSASS